MSLLRRRYFGGRGVSGRRGRLSFDLAGGSRWHRGFLEVLEDGEGAEVHAVGTFDAALETAEGFEGVLKGVAEWGVVLNAIERIGRPFGDPPTLSTDWFADVGLIAAGLTTRLMLPVFRKPMYSLPSGPNAVDVGRSPARPAKGATWLIPENGLKSPNWL